MLCLKYFPNVTENKKLVNIRMIEEIGESIMNK